MCCVCNFEALIFRDQLGQLLFYVCCYQVGIVVVLDVVVVFTFG